MDSDTIFCIFECLPLHDFLACSSINKQFYLVSKNELLWKKLNNCNDIIDNYHTNYMKHHTLNNFMRIINVKTPKDYPIKYCPDSPLMLDRIFGVRIHKVPCETCSFRSTQILHLTHRYFGQIPSQIGSLTNLTDLFLIKNNLESLPSQMSSLTNLKHLQLSHNRFKFFPIDICSLTHLQTLSLSFNELESLPYEITSLTNLKCFFVQRNNLSIIPQEIESLINLEFMDFRENNLLSITPGISKLTKLKMIYLSDDQGGLLSEELARKFEIPRLAVN